MKLIIHSIKTGPCKMETTLTTWRHIYSLIILSSFILDWEWGSNNKSKVTLYIHPSWKEALMRSNNSSSLLDRCIVSHYECFGTNKKAVTGKRWKVTELNILRGVTVETWEMAITILLFPPHNPLTLRTFQPLIIIVFTLMLFKQKLVLFDCSKSHLSNLTNTLWSPSNCHLLLHPSVYSHVLSFNK